LDYLKPLKLINLQNELIDIDFNDSHKITTDCCYIFYNWTQE